MAPRNRKHLRSWNPDGSVNLSYGPKGEPLSDSAKAKTLFELSRRGADAATRSVHFDFSIHTFAALKAGISGHNLIDCVDGNDSECPLDRTFRKAWVEKVLGEVDVDMPKARGVHMDVIRKARNIELAAKDITFMRAVEAGDTSAQATIATEKQTLRDIPQTFDLTTDTPEQLKAKWPSELPARE